MKNTSLPPEPPPVTPAEDLPTVQDVAPPVPHKKISKMNLLITFLVLPILILAVTVPAVMRSQIITGQAAGEKCRLITRVSINPGEINTFISSRPTELSVLAYDYYDKPINEGVQYEWGMSSTNSIGTVKSKHDLASFIPRNAGVGDLYVKAKNKCTVTAVIGSIKVTVQQGVPTTPTVRPRPTVKPTPTIRPRR